VTRRNALSSSIVSLLLATGAPCIQCQARQTMSPEVSQFVRVDGSQSDIRLLHVRVIDGSGAAALSDQTVLIRAGKIESVRPTSAEEVANGQTVLDMTGRTVLPGLVGMHDHLFYVARPKDNAEVQSRIPALLPQMSYSAPRLYLANGVTTIRTTGSLDPYTDLNLKAQIEAHQLPGPHMDVTGPYLQGEGNPFLQMHTVHGPEETRKMVDYWADQGVTSFKAYTHLTRAELKAAIDESHRRGLKITGHLCSVTYPEAAEMGIDNLEHGFFVNTQLDPNKTPDVCPPSFGGPTLKKMTPDSPEAKALIELLVRRHVAVTSTLTVFEADGNTNPPLQQRWLEVMTPQARETYLYERNVENTVDRTAYERYHLFFKQGQELERRFVAAGGLLLAGPDPTGDGHIIPGFADQREIELLVDGGFTPLEAIKIGTLNGATYLGQADRIGSVVADKNADLLVVKGDPSSRIADIENVELVFQDGRGFDPPKLLDSVKGLYGLY
jgi:imidazolonepropionase-like amidohydrolase